MLGGVAKFPARIKCATLAWKALGKAMEKTYSQLSIITTRKRSENMGVPELEEYKFGFHDDVEPVFSTGEGLTEEVIREMSRIKGKNQNGCLNSV